MRLVWVVMLATLALPGTALGHSPVRQSGDELIFSSEDVVSNNRLAIEVRGTELRLFDPNSFGGIDAPHCRPGATNGRGEIIEVFCPAASVGRLRIDLGEREDVATIGHAVPVTAVMGPGADVLSTNIRNDFVVGNEGNDRLSLGDGDDEGNGGDGDDTLEGAGGADKLTGGLGVDVLDGGENDDTIVSRDGLADRVTCGGGTDAVDADTVDEVAADCENVTRIATAPPEDPNPGAGDDKTPPRVATGASTTQRLRRARRVYVAATSSERGFLSASGYVSVVGRRYPVRSNRLRVTVAGGGVELRIVLSRALARRVVNADRRGRRAYVRLDVVASDLAGNSAAARAPRIRLRR